MQSDTRKFLTVGAVLSLIGVLAVALMFAVGNVNRQGPHTNLGWISLVVVMGCLPLGLLTLLLGLAKLLGNRNRQ